jgi:hypothetical protein
LYQIGIEIDTFFILVAKLIFMDSKKNQEKKNLTEDKVFNESEDKTELLEGKTLHDLYRHTAKLIK